MLLAVALDLVLGTIDGIIDLINDFSVLFGGRKVTNFKFPLEKLVKINTVSYAEVRNALSSLPSTCTRFESMPEILLWTTRLVLHDYTCPLVRFTYPSSAMYSLSSNVLGWTFYGSAKPILLTENDNCAASETVSQSEEVCAVLGIGFILLEFCLPSKSFPVVVR